MEVKKLDIHVHKVDKKIHSKFLIEARSDPFTKEKIKHGDQIVFCAVCKSVFLYESWQLIGGKHCNQYNTLSEFVDLQTTAIRFGNSSTAQNLPKTRYSSTQLPSRNSTFNYNLNSNLKFLGGLLFLGLMLFFIVKHTNQSRKQITRLPVINVQSEVNKISPQKAIENYYFNINSSNYKTAWNQLSSKFRNNKKGKLDDYSSYIDWWRKVRRVEIQNVQLLNTEDRKATVDTQLQYLMKSGKVVSQSLRFLLLWDVDANNWIIDETSIIFEKVQDMEQSLTTETIYEWKFPMEKCGDNNPSGLQNFYPVFVNSISQDTLKYIKNNYCNDAYIKYRRTAKRKSIQVASFLNKSTADKFAIIMKQDQRIGSGEVAESTLN